MPIKWPEGKRPVFVGAGATQNRRYSGRTVASLANEAALEAIADAGLKPEDIDGLASWPNPAHAVARNIAGYDRLDVNAMMNFVPFQNIRWFCQTEMPAAGVVSMVQEAALALGAGVCNYALIYRCGHHPPGLRYQAVSTQAAPGMAQFQLIYGHGVGGALQALPFQRYLDKFGAKREDMATYILNANRNAQLDERAAWYGRGITFDDYMNARLIAYPMCVFDNDMPVDGVKAVVMTTEDRAKDTPHPGGYIAGMGVNPWNMLKGGGMPGMMGGGGGIAQTLEDQYEMEFAHARNLYESAGLHSEDVDLIHVYDGFSPMVWNLLETFGFCGVGEAHDWIQGGTIAYDGPHPVNTSGGNLGDGRIHGMTHIHETARQMMGTAGTAQLKKLDVALCETGPFGMGSSFLCTRE